MRWIVRLLPLFALLGLATNLVVGQPQTTLTQSEAVRLFRTFRETVRTAEDIAPIQPFLSSADRKQLKSLSQAQQTEVLKQLREMLSAEQRFQYAVKNFEKMSPDGAKLWMVYSGPGVDAQRKPIKLFKSTTTEFVREQDWKVRIALALENVAHESSLKEAAQLAAEQDREAEAQRDLEVSLQWEKGVEFNPKDRSMMTRISGGSFRYGSDSGEEDEKPERLEQLPSFYISAKEVTNAQFRRFVAESGYDAGEQWMKYAARYGENAPVVSVTWYHARAYCRWAGLRLPTEQEWERAARGKNGRVYPWGNSWDPQRAWCSESAGGKPHRVGTKPSGSSSEGCMDLCGNVSEWTSSEFDGRPDRPFWSEGEASEKVIRGGSWLSRSDQLRSSNRDGHPPASSVNTLGFRCAGSVEK